jgi:hypothetical protein
MPDGHLPSANRHVKFHGCRISREFSFSRNHLWLVGLRILLKDFGSYAANRQRRTRWRGSA